LRGDSFSRRIFLSLAGLLLLFLVAAAIFGEINLRRVLGNDADLRMARMCDLLEAPAIELLVQHGDKARFAQRLRDLGAAERLRLTVISANGDVVADSEVEGPMANHLERPEMQEAERNVIGRARRRSTSTGKNSAYLAHRLDHEGVHVGYIRATSEETEIEAQVRTLDLRLIAFGVAAAALGLGAIALITRWLAQPLERVERDAARLASGDLRGQVHPEGPLEVRRLAETLNTMSRELSSRLESQRRARTEIETILASMAEGVVAVDGKERVLLMNHAAASMLGLSAPLPTGTALWERIRYPDLERGLRGSLSGRGVWHGDAVSPAHDGRMIGLSVAPIASVPAGTSPGGEAAPFSGAVALLSDVTAIRRLEQVRIDFVANVSHELRTPLAAVMGALETLGDPTQPADAHARFLDIANRNAARLQAIVSDLLDLSSIEAEGDRMPLEPVRIDAPLRTAASALAGAAESKGVKLDVQPPLDPPVLVNGNLQRLEQVFTNLLENAIKYTPAGGRVTARVRTGARDVFVDVEDTGIGIPTQHLPRVFERFYRVDRSRSRDMGGTGLGLAIVKHVLRAHAGQVSVRSEEGHGTTFTVSLPAPSHTSRN
jgi:two-component system, OmpR family, phosphate regulon sensor histidine kinase PhoR